eukprot:TRINITY_DN20669_c0_g1_i3.p1 TRINITY_DN20669_c0_g1~~TRINITY_DN20669_c0_g1_i3.p1  ORF type:complete len:125 (-),score=24.72 TRINITY_DN20669_c0_g1_i3:301-675(-)
MADAQPAAGYAKNDKEETSMEDGRDMVPPYDSNRSAASVCSSYRSSQASSLSSFAGRSAILHEQAAAYVTQRAPDAPPTDGNVTETPQRRNWTAAGSTSAEAPKRQDPRRNAEPDDETEIIVRV